MAFSYEGAKILVHYNIANIKKNQLAVIFLNFYYFLGSIKRETSTNTILAKSGDGSIIGLMRRVFLPEGFPESVSSDYLEYQAWDTLQVRVFNVANNQDSIIGVCSLHSAVSLDKNIEGSGD